MFSRLSRYRLDHRLKSVYERYQQFLMPGLLFFGFVVDIITFRSLDLGTSLIILGAHAIVVTAAIIYANLYDRASSPPAGAVFSYLRFTATLAQQFSVGALLSASLLFYWFSGAFSASWPVMIMLVALMASNEVFRAAFLRPIVQIGLYAFVLLSYAVLLFPYLLRSLGPTTFVLGAVASTVVSVSVAAITSKAGSRREGILRNVGVPIAVFGAFASLYFLDVIPPVPLAIREAGIYHALEVRGGVSVPVDEAESPLAALWPGQAVQADPDGRLYAFVSVFAPAELTTSIYHRWQRYDDAAGEWRDVTRQSYPIRGGRDDGYRGYTYTSRATPGKWRVIVETARGQVLGRIPFTYY